MNVARWGQRAALVGSACLLTATFWPNGSARAALPTPPDAYGAQAEAAGVEYSLDRRPGFAQVPDVIHGATPRAASSIGNGPASEAQANSIYFGGLEAIPGLVCLAGLPCGKIPAPGGFPPPFPTEAHAQYPTPKTSDATVHGKPVGPPGAPLTFYPGNIHAEAGELSNSGTASNASSTFFKHSLDTGSSVSRTTNSINSKGAVVGTAESTVNDINIANGLIHIGAVHSFVSITYDGSKKPTIQSSTTVSGVSVLGLPATIDQNGIRISSASNKTALKVLNEQLNFLLNSSYITVALLAPTANHTEHAYQQGAGGLLISFDDTVSGVPNPPPVEATLIPYCDLLLNPLQNFFDKNGIPIVLCAPPPPPDVNARYFGTVLLGGAGVINAAANDKFTFPMPSLGSLGGLGSGPTSSFVAGTPGTQGIAGSGAGLGANPPPNVAQNPQMGPSAAAGFLENFGDAATRLKYLFPALLLAVVGVLAGRIGRAPARLPTSVR